MLRDALPSLFLCVLPTRFPTRWRDDDSKNDDDDGDGDGDVWCVSGRRLRKSASKHATLYKEAMAGKGIDRHLFGLYIASIGLVSPSLPSPPSSHTLQQSPS